MENLIIAKARQDAVSFMASWAVALIKVTMNSKWTILDFFYGLLQFFYLFIFYSCDLVNFNQNNFPSPLQQHLFSNVLRHNKEEKLITTSVLCQLEGLVSNFKCIAFETILLLKKKRERKKKSFWCWSLFLDWIVLVICSIYFFPSIISVYVVEVIT